MHWISTAAIRASLKGAESLVIPADATDVDAWEIASRSLGLGAPELTRALAAGHGLPVADLDHLDLRATALVPERIARRHRIVPVAMEQRRLIVATATPLDFVAEHAVGFATGRRVDLALAAPTAIEAALFSLYGGEREMEHLLSTIDEEIADAVHVLDDVAPEAIAHAEIDAAPVVKLTNVILRDAVSQGASDIHVEPGTKTGAVRFRIDGVMRHYMHLSMAALNRVVSRIKVLGRLDIADRIRPQDGRSRVMVDGRYVDLRISTVCTRDAEKAVIRLLRPDNTRRLDDVGITPNELARLRRLLNCRDGIVIVTGPTGSGKTTTLYSAIRELATGAVNISTVEDPIEYELAGITQIQVEPKRGVTFANTLRALLRQDPDVIFVGEIRDAETAEIAAHAALTGHLVLASLHTNDAVSAVTRLRDLGLDPQTIAATLRGAVAQRLLRRICPDCATSVSGELTAEETALAERYGVAPTTRASGCKRCGNTGYRGRLPLVEVATVTPALAEQIAAGASVHRLQLVALEQGMTPMREVAVGRVRRGETTLQELERVVGDNTESRATPANRPAVLLLSADPLWRRVARAVLHRAGARTIEAADAADANRILASGENIALTLTDTMLPLGTPAEDAVYGAAVTDVLHALEITRLPSALAISS